MWKDSFLEKKKPKLNTAEKIIDFLVRLTSLNILGFNPVVAVSNVLAGKYQEYRKRGGKTFKLGEILERLGLLTKTIRKIQNNRI